MNHYIKYVSIPCRKTLTAALWRRKSLLISMRQIQELLVWRVWNCNIPKLVPSIQITCH